MCYKQKHQISRFNRSRFETSRSTRLVDLIDLDVRQAEALDY